MKKKQKLAFLAGVKILLSDRKRWTKGTEGRTAVGTTVPALSANAEQWCLIGAGKYVCSGLGLQFFGEASTVLKEAIEHHKGYPVPIDSFNDAASTTHADVMKVLDSEINLLNT